MRVRIKNIFSTNELDLSPAQRHMYSAEKLMNFRWISKVVATYSPHILTSADLASADLQLELARIGEFAELAYCGGVTKSLPFEFVFQNLPMMLKTDFPLEGYDAVKGSVLVSSFRGSAAGVSGYVAYRSPIKQLVVAICGTTSITQALYDVRFLAHRYPGSPGCKVHTGFWKMYKGAKLPIVEAIRAGLKKHEVASLVVTGHSMGGALSYLLAFDLMADRTLLPSGLPLKLVTFGTPRCGNSKLSQYWLDVVNDYRKNGALEEFQVKAFNDGVPSLPPLNFGYRHFTRTPLYFVGGRLYHIPSTEYEYALFIVSSQFDGDTGPIPKHPRGGHNYYNGRNMEKLLRRMQRLENSKVHQGVGEWEKEYKKRIARDELVS